MSQETFTTIVYIIAVIIAGSIIGVFFAVKFLRDWLGKEHKHLEEKVAKPITDSNQQLTNSIADLNGVLSIQREALTDALKAKDQVLDATKTQLQMLEKEKDESIADRRKLNQQIIEIQDKQRQRDTTIEQLQRQIEQLETALRGKDTDLTTAQQTITELRNQLAEATQLNSDIDELRNRVKALEEKVQAMLQKEQQLIAENQILTQQLEEANKAIALKDERIKALENELNVLKAEKPTSESHATATPATTAG